MTFWICMTLAAGVVAFFILFILGMIELAREAHREKKAHYHGPGCPWDHWVDDDGKMIHYRGER